MSRKIIWCGEHLGACIGLAEEDRRYEISLYRTFWSVAGSGVTVFARFSENTGLAPLNGIYTNNEKLSDYMRVYVLRVGKQESNIARTLGGPVVNAEFNQTDNIPANRIECFSFDQQKVEIQYNLADPIHFQNQISSCNENVLYSYTVIKTESLEIRLQGSIREKISAFDNGIINEYNCFFSICEVWTTKEPIQNHRYDDQAYY